MISCVIKIRAIEVKKRVRESLLHNILLKSLPKDYLKPTYGLFREKPNSLHRLWDI
jgi:hypothetical protein